MVSGKQADVSLDALHSLRLPRRAQAAHSAARLRARNDGRARRSRRRASG